MQSFQSKPTFAASRALHDSLSQSASEMSMVGICLRGCVETRGSAAREAGPLLTSELLLVFLESYTCPHSSQPLKTRRSLYACKAIPKDTHTCLHRRVSIYLSLYSSVCIFLQQEMTHIDCDCSFGKSFKSMPTCATTIVDLSTTLLRKCFLHRPVAIRTFAKDHRIGQRGIQVCMSAD